MDSSMFDGILVKSNRIIYTPSDFAKANLLHLQEAGTLYARRPHTSRRKNLSSYLFFCVIEGSGSLEYEGNTFELKAGDCVFVDCKKAYAHSCSESLWTLKWVHFFGPNMGGIYGKYVERGGANVFSPADCGRYAEIVDRIFEAAVSDSYIKDMLIYEKLTALLTLLMEQSLYDADEGEDGRPPSRLGRGKNAHASHAGKRQNLQTVKDYLDEHYMDRVTLDYLAETFFINKFYLTRIFKEQFGESIMEYLLQVRITQAKQRLRFSEKAIETIALECGMRDPNYFSRVFKKVEGVTPGEYRRMW